MSKTAFVTGSAAGIGAAVVKLLKDRGYAVGGFDLADQAGSPCDETYSGDVLEIGAVQEAAASFSRKYGGIDSFICAVGIVAKAPLATGPYEQMVRVLDINIKGSMLSCREVLPFMSKGSSIVLFSSCISKSPKPGMTAYGASKGAMDAFARALAIEVAPDIRVNAVAPGLVNTGIWRTAGMSGEAFDDLMARRGAEYPLGRVGVPEDIAAAIGFLISPEASWITGVVLPIDGGEHLG